VLLSACSTTVIVGVMVWDIVLPVASSAVSEKMVLYGPVSSPRVST